MDFKIFDLINDRKINKQIEEEQRNKQIKEIQKEKIKEVIQKKLRTESNAKEKVIVLCGASCTGKDTLLNLLKEEYDFNTVVSYTTRPKRINEVEGKDYYFIKKSKFIDMIKNNEFIEYKRYVAYKSKGTDGKEKKEVWFYGTSKEEFEKVKNKICILDVSGINKIKAFCGEKNLVVIYLHSEDELREKRAKSRKDFDENKWKKRTQFDKENFTKDFIKKDANFIIANNNNKEYLMAQAEKVMKSYGIRKREEK